MKHSLLSVYKDNNRHGSVERNYNAETILSQTHTGTHTNIHALFHEPTYFSIIPKPFSPNLPSLDCYLHLKYQYQNLKFLIFLIFIYFAKTLKTLNTWRGPSLQQTHKHTHTQRTNKQTKKTLLRHTNSFWSRACAVSYFFFIVKCMIVT